MSTRRIRDPIHGLITFDLNDPVDDMAWNIIDTTEFQRLRHIRQLGLSEYVFPGATHTRFAHSVGVFHNARRLMKIIKRDEGSAFDERKSLVSLLAALVHDVGHGPFSHAFEVAREKIAASRQIAAIEKHEAFSAKIISNANGNIRQILDKTDKKLADEIADLIRADDPKDIYHAVVSSSFDADRLDYLVRDRHMTGVQSGAIDQDWLIDNLVKWDIDNSQDDDEPNMIATFVFKGKARQAAEDFLLARYRLYSQLYLHKTTRGFEQIVGAILVHLANHRDNPEKVGLTATNPFVKFFGHKGETLENYVALSDDVFWATIRTLSISLDARAVLLSTRLLARKRLRVLDVSAECGHDPGAQLSAEKRLDNALSHKLGNSVFKDLAPNYLYGRNGGETTKAHKMVRVLDGAGKPREITDFPDTIISDWLTQKKQLVRYYFLEDEDFRNAERILRGK